MACNLTNKTCLGKVIIGLVQVNNCSHIHLLVTHQRGQPTVQCSNLTFDLGVALMSLGVAALGLSMTMTD